MMRQPRSVVFSAYLILVLVLGGASAAGLAGNIGLQLAGSMMLAAALWHNQPGTNVSTGLSRFLMVFAAVAAMQFLPLPPALWAILPGRDTIAKGFDIAGMARPWLKFSLDPWSSLHSLIWWLPAFALLATTRGNWPSTTRSIVWSICGVAYVSVLLASIQALSGAGYFYSITNVGNGVGFFANSNHFGTFMLIAMALLAGDWFANQPKPQRQRSAVPPGIMLALLMTPFLLGVYLSASLACGLLLIPLIAGIAMMSRPDIRIRWPIVGVAAIALAVAMVWLLTSGTLSNDLLTKSGTPGISRGDFLATGLKILKDFQPIGSGIGTFAQLYPWYEQIEQVGGTFVNHAHNDVLELLIETGIFGAVLAALFLIWLGKTAKAVWSVSNQEGSIAKGATLAVALVMCHSLVDYPLRTAAISSLVAVCCVLARRPIDARRQIDTRDGAGKREIMIDI